LDKILVNFFHSCGVFIVHKEDFMKKFLFAGLIGLTALGAQAHGFEHHGYRGGYERGLGWVAPAVIGGAVVYAATRPPVIVQQTPIVVQQPPTVYQPPYGYHWESVLDANCNCYRNVLVPN
jgi:hypothetical protein